MPKCVSNGTLDRLIVTTTIPEDVPMAGTLHVTAVVAGEINTALRELKRLRKYVAKLKRGEIGHYGPG